MSIENKKTSEKLVFISKDNQAITTSFVIAKGIDVEHKILMDNIIKYEDQLNKLGKLIFKEEKEQFVLLNEMQATFLISLSINTEQILKLKCSLIESFYKVKEEIDLFTNADKKLLFKLKNSLIGKIDNELLLDILNYTEEIIEEIKENASIAEYQDITDKYTLLPKNLVNSSYNLIKEQKNTKISLLNLTNNLEQIIKKLQDEVTKIRKNIISSGEIFNSDNYDKIIELLEKENSFISR